MIKGGSKVKTPSDQENEGALVQCFLQKAGVEVNKILSNNTDTFPN